MNNSATYSPEDNKLRLYVGRVPRADYDRLRAAGFVSTPKQSCDFVATWSPSREDLAREFLDDGEDIGDEDYSPLERSADRAERFEGYREKRTGEALDGADKFESGPQAFGHQNQQRAERQALRHDRKRTYAVSQWSKAEYWQQRTEGVISHALYRSSASVRRGRILVLEAEQRKLQKSRDEYAKRYRFWQKVLTLPGGDTPIQQTEGYNEQKNGVTIMHLPRNIDPTPAGKLAYALANYGSSGDYIHPRTGAKKCMYSLMVDPVDPITPREAATLWLADASDPAKPSRWLNHYELRLTYERAMLAQEGGSAAAADMEPGGWICTGNSTGSVFTNVETGWKQIQAVNKSPATGRVTSVKVFGKTYSAIREHNGKPCLVSVNIERLPEGAYRPPNAEERAVFLAEKQERKANEKATKPKAPPLINPTDEDAQRLQDDWNTRAHAKHEAKRKENYCLPDFVPTSVRRMTQAEYSERSKGAYGSCQTSDISETLNIRRATLSGTAGGRVTVFKVRTGYSESRALSSSAPRAVIVITDKTQKPIPWAEVAKERKKQPTTESLFHRLEDMAKAMAKAWDHDQTDEEKQLLSDARYVGWAWSQSATQRGFTDEGKAAYAKFQEIQKDGGKPIATGTLYNTARAS